MTNLTETCLTELLAALGADPRDAARVCFSGRPDALPSPYAVGAFAAASCAAALLAIAQLHALRRGTSPASVALDHLHAAAAFRGERYLRGEQFQVPAAWDPIAGDYRAADGFVRLHTNYPWHRRAALAVLGVAENRQAVAEAVARWSASALEAAVIARGGAAAAMHTPEAFAARPAGRALAAEPLVGRVLGPRSHPLTLDDGPLPLSGVRVLDFTRVIAGPVCTRVLAAYGADVLRIDPPAFCEVEALLCDTTWGKRRAFLDLQEDDGRAQLRTLLTDAHVIVLGYASSALARLGLDPARLAAEHPGLVIVHLNAYGHTGPWAARRGFDSLVQMSCGIAAHGARVAQQDAPLPLPAQALDHGTGYLAAAAVACALGTRLREARGQRAALSLARTARALMALGDAHPITPAPLDDAEVARFLVRVDTHFGAAWRIGVPGRIDGLTPRALPLAGPLGVDAPTFAWNAG